MNAYLSLMQHHCNMNRKMQGSTQHFMGLTCCTPGLDSISCYYYRFLLLTFCNLGYYFSGNVLNVNSVSYTSQLLGNTNKKVADFN